MSRTEPDTLEEKIANDLGVSEEHALEMFKLGLEEEFIVIKIPESEISETQREEIIAQFKNAGYSPEELIEWV